MVVTMPFGLFEFIHMLFKLRNAGQAFQRLMDVVTADLNAIFAYLDDVIVASGPKNHMEALKLVFDKLQQHRLVMNLDKCVRQKWIPGTLDQR
jgi:hypothetical protein